MKFRLIRRYGDFPPNSYSYTDPKSFGQYIESGIPGLRQNVPVKAPPNPAAGKLP